ncbi:hypothetical protein QWZ08_15485 [Ferruginibacter paludis]|uniref:hypothetical protein n=1 Tax=Ferruginibacter paludis TaxID=1310417 RepID=UPI0025B59FF7|nr:hypothetical protein [Ferruginibacter paludis]MDN3657051.1 hypothetical protein [Ferruginibacter paludis]
MKKFLPGLALLLISTGVFSQQSQTINTSASNTSAVVQSQQDKPIKITTPNDYLRKSRIQKTFAWILAGIGAVFIIAPLTDTKSTETNNTGWFDLSGLDKSLDAASYTMGAVFIGASVPLFIAGHRNKLKAEGEVGLMRLNTPQWSSNVPPAFPSAGIKIYFR